MVARSSKGISDTKGFVGVGFGGADNRTLDFLAKYESLRIHQKLISSRYPKGDVGSNTTLHCKRKDLNRCSPTRIPVQTEIDIAEWEE